MIKYPVAVILFLITSLQCLYVKAGVVPFASVADSLVRPLRSTNPYPAISGRVGRLFYLQRNPNTNTVVYELNTDKAGQLDADNPVHAYWIRYADKGQKEELNYIQRKFAYGLVTKQLGNGKYDVRFVSYKKFPLNLMKAEDGKYHIFATISQKQIILSRIFIKIEGGSFWLPNVMYVELSGTDPATGKEVLERFKP